MSENKLIGYLSDSEVLNGKMIEDNPLQGTVLPSSGVEKYDDTELRELIENTLNESKEYADNKVASFVEEDPTMLAISNLEIEEILKKWEE